ncbi:hypothetical protein CAFE_06320 [Caprobacter fermentans]|uniref:Uncharacterized protein n=1 Tax=Caproicibacter fermentans TaxID=2576756 RepID=A0A6N8HVY3_9FIRM|nr:hypothetical protein [Caproicibacter fermentans]
MKSYLELIPISAKIHKKQSRMTRICIILAVFLVTAIFGMADMEVRSQQLQEIKSDGNWHVLFSDIDQKTASMIAARPEVTASGWYAYLGTGAQYTVSGKSVIAAGMDKKVSDDIFPIKVTEGDSPTKKNEVALTQNAKLGLGVHVGDTITLKHPISEPVELSVVGFVEGTSKLLKQDSYALLFTKEGFQSSIPEGQYTDQYVVQLCRYCNMQKVIADITEQYKLTDKQVLQNGNLLAVLGQSDNSYVLGLYGTAAVLFAIVMLSGVLMLASSLNSNVMQRTEFFGMMRCLGATKKQIMRFVRKEGLQWCKTAIPVGGWHWNRGYMGAMRDFEGFSSRLFLRNADFCNQLDRYPVRHRCGNIHGTFGHQIPRQKSCVCFATGCGFGECKLYSTKPHSGKHHFFQDRYCCWYSSCYVK